jgi:hypothetical protein
MGVVLKRAYPKFWRAIHAEQMGLFTAYPGEECVARKTLARRAVNDRTGNVYDDFSQTTHTPLHDYTGKGKSIGNYLRDKEKERMTKRHM